MHEIFQEMSSRMTTNFQKKLPTLKLNYTDDSFKFSSSTLLESNSKVTLQIIIIIYPEQFFVKKNRIVYIRRCFFANDQKNTD